MYQNYYSSSDVQLYFSSFDHIRIVKVDTALSLGYSLRQTSAPIYSLGSREVQFFSEGNTIGNGTLTIAFTDEEYLKYCIDEVGQGDNSLLYQTELDNSNSNASNSILEGNFEPGQYRSSRLIRSNAQFIAAAGSSSYKVSGEKRSISIGAIKPLFNIKMFLNNETAMRGSDSKVITLKGIKIIGENFQTSSTQDAPLMISYNFIYKDIERG